MTDVLRQRNDNKAKKPRFRQQDSHKRKRLNTPWRRPRGLHSKVRLHRRGYAKHVTTGYGSPASVKGMTRDGRLPVLVHNVADLAGVDKNSCAVIGHGVGARRKKDIVTAAMEKGVVLFNIKDGAAFLAQLEKKLVARRKARASASKAPLPVSTKEERKETKDAIDAAVSNDERKKAEKAEKDRIITKRV